MFYYGVNFHFLDILFDYILTKNALLVAKMPHYLKNTLLFKNVLEFKYMSF